MVSLPSASNPALENWGVGPLFLAVVGKIGLEIVMGLLSEMPPGFRQRTALHYLEAD